MKKNNSIIDTIGNTPLVRLNNLSRGLDAQIWVKCEFFNPFSLKDRIAKYIIADAEASGKIKTGTTLIEPTSGNTGIALAAIAAAKGYKCILVMPESMSIERRALLHMLGAEIKLTPREQGMSGAINLAEKLLQQTPNSFAPRQFENPANPKAHYETTGPEIWNATNGELDTFVMGIGTGGTFSGTMKFLKEKNPNIRGIAVEPQNSAVIQGAPAGAHAIQGIGAGFIPACLDKNLIDETLCVTDEDAIKTAQELCSKEGIPCGISAGANVSAALSLAKRKEFAGKNIVTIIPDSVDRYLSTELARQATEKAINATPE